MTLDKGIIIAARIVSMIFSPFYLPLMSIALMLTLTFLARFPVTYKILLLISVWLLTVFVPTMLIFIYRLFKKWTSQQLSIKHRRLVPYTITILSYLFCIWLLKLHYVDNRITLVLYAALGVLVASAIINIFWKISTHTAGIGGVAGALVALGFNTDISFVPEGFNPVGWLCLTIIVAGVVGSARMILRQHSVLQVVAGFFLGAVCAYVAFSQL